MCECVPVFARFWDQTVPVRVLIQIRFLISWLSISAAGIYGNSDDSNPNHVNADNNDEPHHQQHHRNNNDYIDDVYIINIMISIIVVIIIICLIFILILTFSSSFILILLFLFSKFSLL